MSKRRKSQRKPPYKPHKGLVGASTRVKCKSLDIQLESVLRSFRKNNTKFADENDKLQREIIRLENLLQVYGEKGS